MITLRETTINHQQFQHEVQGLTVVFDEQNKKVFINFLSREKDLSYVIPEMDENKTEMIFSSLVSRLSAYKQIKYVTLGVACSEAQNIMDQNGEMIPCWSYYPEQKRVHKGYEMYPLHSGGYVICVMVLLNVLVGKVSSNQILSAVNQILEYTQIQLSEKEGLELARKIERRENVDIDFK